ncbi:MAG TPA: MBL fold metallo-hydrolase [Terrimesophilobacter sp.]|nr:MBL fold metallo-hydrolase [Terrimesophilobacter sp.]HRP98855.1 MBL fold metallo-hydrolase [Terrimesophilobacter sp.]
MRVTKHEHACLEIEHSGDTLIVDPGSYTTLLVGVSRVVAVVITHEHADHWSDDQLELIVKNNPDVRIFGPAGVAAAAVHFTIETVAPGDTIEVDPFTLRFFGGRHAVIHSSIPVVDNVGVLINDELYYAGDSFTIPDEPVETLAVPAGAPWLKISDVMDYVTKISPKRAFPVHEMVLSTIGKSLSNARIESSVEAVGGEFFALEPGDAIDL